MIAYSLAARRHIRELTTHYRDKKRPEAVRNLLAALDQAEAAIAANSHGVRDFPATYRTLARPGRAWVKAGRYWIAFEKRDPPVILAVFWDGADLERRF